MNKHISNIIIIFICLLSLNISVFGEGKNKIEKSLPVIVPDFSKHDLSLPNLKLNRRYWSLGNSLFKTINNFKPETVSFSFGESDWQNYDIEFQLKRNNLNPKMKDQHFGVIVRSGNSSRIQIYSRGAALYYLEKVNKKTIRNCKLGNLTSPMKVGKDAIWTSFRIIIKNGCIEVYAANVLIGTITNVIPTSGKIKFYAYNLNIEINNLKVFVTKKTASLTKSGSVSNILHNSSFEQCTLDNLPDYWGVPHWGLQDPYWAVNFKKWQQHFITEKSTAWDGKRSMKIINPENNPSKGLTLWSVCVGAKGGDKYTLSAYMKSVPAGLKVTMGGVRGKVKTFTLTDKWQRYNTVFTKKKNSLYDDMIKIVPLQKGSYWIDAVQLENGPLTAYQPMKNENQQLDTQEGNVDKILTEVQKYNSPYFKHELVLNGKLDDAIWAKVPKMNLVSTSGNSVKANTEAYTWYNDRGIYVGVKCFDLNANNNKCRIKNKDANVWQDPSLEFFIDPQLSRNYYYHLAINQTGIQYDGFCGDMSWNGNWKAKTYTDPAGRFWSAEVFMPFAEFRIDISTGEWWGFNVCRENHAQHEYSCWSPTHGSFHTPERFGQINIKRKIQKKYYVGVNNTQLRSLSGSNASLSARVYNNTNQNQTYTLSAKLLDSKKQRVADFTRSVELSHGGEKTVELGNVNCKQGEKYTLALKLHSLHKRDLCFSDEIDVEVPNVLSIQPQYDTYTNESKMQVQVQLNIGHELFEKSQLCLQICNSDGKEILNETIDKLQQEMLKSINIQKLESGNYILNAKLKTSNEEFTVAKAFHKLPPVEYETKVDHFSRMTVVNGKILLPIGMGLEGNITPECIKYYADRGVNLFSWIYSVSSIKNDLPKIQKLLDAAEQNGVHVQLCPRVSNNVDNYKQKELLKAIILTFRKHPALFGWIVFDEPFTTSWGKNNYSYISSWVDEIKQLDPYHLVSIVENSYGLTYLKNNLLNFPGEIIDVDYYAFPPGRSLQLVSTYAKMMNKMNRNNNPCWMWLFGGGYTFWASRDLTPQEEEFQTYAAIINGITGIRYFADHPKSSSHWTRMKGLFKEIKILSPVLASSTRPPTIKCNTSAIEFIVKKTDNGIYLIAVNNTIKPVKARFDLSESDLLSKATNILFENRQIEIKENYFDDKFAGFQRHVYIFK